MNKTANALTEIGGNEWKKNGMHRIYFNSATVFTISGFEIARYGRGGMSKNEARHLRMNLDTGTIYYDVNTDELICNVYVSVKTLTPFRYAVLEAVETTVDYAEYECLANC